jgi:hydroxymethylpyrimidine pyrophosphatase-like HAD family hydrolase
VRALYLDLDGTFLGPGGIVVHDAEKAFTLLGIRAIEACARVGAEVVFMTGRNKSQVAEDARLFGQTSYIYELGAAMVLDGEEHWMTGDMVPGSRSIHDQIEDGGAPALLLREYAGRFEYHDPWHRGREVSHLFRGLVDAFEVDALLRENGFVNLRLVDNGVVHRRSPALADLPQVRAYHLVPAEASKAGAVASHIRMRGYAPSDVIAVGDSREDLTVAANVGTFWLVANGLAKDPTIREALGQYPNVRVTEEGYGPGVYEAVVTTFAEAGARGAPHGG